MLYILFKNIILTWVSRSKCHTMLLSCCQYHLNQKSQIKGSVSNFREIVLYYNKDTV